MDSPQLTALLAASRGEQGPAVLVPELPAVASAARQALAAIQAAPQHEPREGQQEDDSPQHRLLLCFRVLRNAAAAGPAAATTLLEVGILDLAAATLRLVGTAAIPLDWALPAAVAQALANLCTASATAAAAAWAALFPLQLSMLAHVNTGEEGRCCAGQQTGAGSVLA